VPELNLANLTRSVKCLFERVAGSGLPDPTNPVINGATTTSKPFLRNLLADIVSQGSRLGENIGLVASLADTKLFDGGIVDDSKYEVSWSGRLSYVASPSEYPVYLPPSQMEQIVQLAASLPIGSDALDNLAGKFVKVLWDNLEHPPLSYQGDEYKYRTADGRNNNVMYPHLGQAGSSYARTVTPQTLQPGVWPDPSVVFDAIYARGKVAREHPNKLSSMLFYLASIIIHDIFHTDERDCSRVKTSSYLDLAPLYGSCQKEQDNIRAHKDGLLKPDAFSNSRVLGFPPGVSAILVCFNRFHNYVALQLAEINEGGRFDIPTKENDERAWRKRDNDLFQTARLVTCGLYINIILTDYVRTILNLNRTDTTWTLDPRKDCDDVFDGVGVPLGIGNAVSVEFNLVYRWHSAISVKDEQWCIDLYKSLFPGRDIHAIAEDELIGRLRQWAMEQDSDPGKWNLDGGKYKRDKHGRFNDEDLVNILSDATEDVACAFGPRNVPIVMKLVETMGIKQARDWQVATLNEFRKFFKLKPHKEFSDITKDVDVAQSLEALYGHPDYVELYPGLVAEDAKKPLDPGSGLCPGFTVSRSILADAVALARGDRFYTVDYTPANLTNWGFNQVKSDPEVAGGHCIHNLFMRALPSWYRGNSVYAMYPFVVPEENRRILAKLKKEQDYDFTRPSFVPIPTAIRTWKGVTSILADQYRFKVPWGPHTSYLTGHDYMLSGDGPKEAVQHTEVMNAIYCPVNGLDQVRIFYEDLTTQLVQINSQRLRDDWFQLDACRDVGNPSHAIFVAKLFHLPLKAPGDLKVGVTVDQLYLAMSVLFAYVFLDLDTARSFKLKASAKQATDQMAKLVKLVCQKVNLGEQLHLTSLFSLGHAGELLEDYGVKLLERLFEGGKSVDEVAYTVIPTAAAAIATQAQHFTQMLDIYLSDDYKHHWADIQACAWSDDPADFEKLKGYALEANRLAPAAFGLLRVSNTNAEIQDGVENVHVHQHETIYLDFISAGLDASVFPDPKTIDPGRDRGLYLHHGYGAHKCIGRAMVEVSMAAQLKGKAITVLKQKNLPSQVEKARLIPLGSIRKAEEPPPRTGPPRRDEKDHPAAQPGQQRPEAQPRQYRGLYEGGLERLVAISYL